jgi:hypothetical protein
VRGGKLKNRDLKCSVFVFEKDRERSVATFEHEHDEGRRRDETEVEGADGVSQTFKRGHLLGNSQPHGSLQS